MPRPGEAAPTPEEIDRRRLRAMELRKKGWTYRRIADELGISANQAHDDVNHELRKRNAELREESLELRAMEAERLDYLIENLHEKVPHSLDAVETYLKVINRRAKLFGLDAPTVRVVEDGDKRSEAKRLSNSQAWQRLQAIAQRLQAAGIPLKPELQATINQRNPFEALADIEATPVLALPDSTPEDKP